MFFIDADHSKAVGRQCKTLSSNPNIATLKGAAHNKSARGYMIAN